ncbi:hypothetical protein ACIQOU_19810 [Streptomyces sp. NPDC091279]|uniref:hypothetical protein n=1 Tax=unclassified Streptomyces TaxID=2593676 RepID=UPI0038145890
MDQVEEPKALAEGWSTGLGGALVEVRQRLLTDVVSYLDALDRIREEEKHEGRRR